MEPKLPAPNVEPLPHQYNQAVEQMPGLMPEITVEQNKERLEQNAEAPKEQTPSTSLSIGAGVATLPIPPQSQADDNIVPVAADDNPIVANDDDLIEKEWVDKAKKIIVETKDDPYKREQEVGKLQVDYLRKRYGKELGSSE